MSHHSLVHNGQSQRPSTPPLSPFIFWSLCLFIPWHFSISTRPPTTQISGGVQGPWGLGMEGSGGLDQRIPTPPTQAGRRMSYAPSLGGAASGDGNPDWVGKTSSTLPGGRPCRVRVRTVPHRTVSPCLTAYDPHSSRPHFFKSGHTAWHGTKESTWYLARNYHEPSTVPARKRATGPSQPEPGICTVPYRTIMSSSQQQACTGYSNPALALARACGEGGLIARTTHSLTHLLTVRDRWLVGHWPVYPLGRPALLSCLPSL